MLTVFVIISLLYLLAIYDWGIPIDAEEFKAMDQGEEITKAYLSEEL